MKASPNNSTSKAQKSKNPSGWNARSATELIFGLQRTYRTLEMQKNISKYCIFKTLHCVPMQTRQFRDFLKIPDRKIC